MGNEDNLYDNEKEYVNSYRPIKGFFIGIGFIVIILSIVSIALVIGFRK
jgi:uncharacterized membrane protein